MADDHFERFRQSLQTAKPAATQEQRSSEMQEDFARLMSGVGRLSEMLDEHQSSSSIAWIFGNYHAQADQLTVRLRGAKASGSASELKFIYQDHTLLSERSEFSPDINAKLPKWFVHQQDDLLVMIVDYYSEFFSKP